LEATPIIDRPVLQHQPHLAVVLHHLPELRLEPAAVRALIVEPFDDRDVAIRIAGNRHVRITQHRGLVRFLGSAGASRRREGGCTGEQAQHPAPAMS
jgi:hypothetical protein